MRRFVPLFLFTALLSLACNEDLMPPEPDPGEEMVLAAYEAAAGICAPSATAGPPHAHGAGRRSYSLTFELCDTDANVGLNWTDGWWGGWISSSRTHSTRVHARFRCAHSTGWHLPSFIRKWWKDAGAKVESGSITVSALVNGASGPSVEVSCP